MSEIKNNLVNIADTLQKSLKNRTMDDRLAYFAPKSGEGVFLPAGTVHSLGGDTCGDRSL